MIKITRTRKIHDDDALTLESEVKGSLASEMVRKKVLEEVRLMDLLLWGEETTSTYIGDNVILDSPTVNAKDIQDDMEKYPETWIV